VRIDEASKLFRLLFPLLLFPFCLAGEWSVAENGEVSTDIDGDGVRSGIEPWLDWCDIAIGDDIMVSPREGGSGTAAGSWAPANDSVRLGPANEFCGDAGERPVEVEYMEGDAG
jgi:hypothetical protein